MNTSKKIVQPSEKIVESLENLKKELDKKVSVDAREVWFKINSCIYSEYPHNRGIS